MLTRLIYIVYLLFTMRNILLRFNEQDELIKLIDRVTKKLGNSASALTKTALYIYCKQFDTGEKQNEPSIQQN